MCYNVLRHCTVVTILDVFYGAYERASQWSAINQYLTHLNTSLTYTNILCKWHTHAEIARATIFQHINNFKLIKMWCFPSGFRWKCVQLGCESSFECFFFHFCGRFRSLPQYKMKANISSTFFWTSSFKSTINCDFRSLHLKCAHIYYRWFFKCCSLKQWL